MWLGCAGAANGAAAAENMGWAPHIAAPWELTNDTGEVVCVARGAADGAGPNNERISDLVSFAALDGFAGGGGWKSKENKSSRGLLGAAGCTCTAGEAVAEATEEFLVAVDNEDDSKIWLGGLGTDGRAEGGAAANRCVAIGAIGVAGGTDNSVSAGCTGGRSLSRMEGSEGGGPSKAHRRLSYLDRMKESIL